MKLTIPDPSLLLLIGASGAGKSTFAGRHFRPTEVVSSDRCRGLVDDDENSMEATADAFELLHLLLEKRLARHKLTVVDATNVRREDRAKLIAIARRHHRMVNAVVFNLPERLLHERNALRPDRDFGPHVVRGHRQAIRRSLGGLRREGIRRIYTLRSQDEVDAVDIERQPLWNDRRQDRGPFDVVGDVHGCLDELLELMERLGWEVDGKGLRARHPEGRRLVLLGDLVDRGPASPQVVQLAMNLVADGVALCVPGNHDVKLLKQLNGRPVQLTHGLDRTVEQIDALPDKDAFVNAAKTFLDGLVSHYRLDDGRLVVAHAGLSEGMHGGASGAVRNFALYGETTGETDEFGLPVRWNWANEYRGQATVLYGHTPVSETQWQNRTLCLDTGCVFGGRLSALRWPERELVQVDARAVYAEPVKPLDHPASTDEPAVARDSLDLADVLGKQILTTRLASTVTLREEQTAAALEVLGRFAVEPRWLIYLPPTMAPPETMAEGPFLERPEPALREFTRAGLDAVLCEEKHMGSRAIVVLVDTDDAARRRFQGHPGEKGRVYTRTGRQFFKDAAVEDAFLGRLRNACRDADLFTRLDSDWLCFDGEILPWSAKAQSLLREQYAPIGAAARASVGRGEELLADAVARLSEAGAPSPELSDVLEAQRERRGSIAAYRTAYGRYCWPTSGLDGVKFAPFHLLAGEHSAYFDRPHLWHLDLIDDLVEAGAGFLHPTGRLRVDLNDPESRQNAVDWWLDLTESGGEGMVIKPLDFVSMGPKGLVQPGIKCRGREYLRIIYGPEYTRAENLERLRRRGLGRKRSLARREFALGVEALERFVAGDGLHKVHPLVFGVLALESEPVDPRL
ncbi:MAG: polynucleotide kinase-phosphatase [Acidobacteriota bacterium]